MREYIISGNDEGQRLDKYLARVLKEADKGFLYRMLRKKNITLNGRKAEGPERLQQGDKVAFFLSEETFLKFAGGEAAPREMPGDASLVKPVYEDSHVLAVDKPAGMLAQKAEEGDVSLCEHIRDYLALPGKEAPAPGFTAGVANRLDRNTSGLVLAGKTLPGQQLLAYLLKQRLVEKYYYCIVKCQKGPARAFRSRLYWQKDEAANTARILRTAEEGALPIELEVRPAAALAEDFALLKVRLITGKTHQIRAQLAYLGYPVLGDAKYGDPELNRSFMKQHAYSLRHQLLHSAEVEFPRVNEETKAASGLSEAALEEWRSLEGKTLSAPMTANLRACLRLLGGETDGV